MTMLLQFAVAAVLIAGMILLRIVTERRVMQTRLRDRGTACERKPCSDGCGTNSVAVNIESVSEKDTLERSVHHAP